MKAILTPQNSTSITYSYQAVGDVLHATVNGVEDSFDFTGMPDGSASDFETVLEPNPLIQATKADGELTVTLLGWYGNTPVQGEDETDEAFQERLAEYELAKTEREVTI
ncbi:hypothetical protein KUW00_15580 [Halomonas sp. DP5N14-9]|uniref:hypothetical protein n=1 Tax=Halomonas sp. DP5N14-9 TaxID=2859075 RepID=UPI001C98E7A2|nr:hypothetical protein [Halomonas sp. DP5N14-9]MBY5942300.1 hypothetical protein [Halomonas sp. DP5N14-9]